MRESNVFFFSIISFAAGVFGGWLLALLDLGFAALMMQILMSPAALGLKLVGQSQLLLNFAGLTYLFCLLIFPPFLNNISLRFISGLAGPSRSASAWALTLGASLTFAPFMFSVPGMFPTGPFSGIAVAIAIVGVLSGCTSLFYSATCIAALTDSQERPVKDFLNIFYK